MMKNTAAADLARTHHAFEVWRANRQRRTRIPPQLWDKAVSLLAHHPLTRVARELRLDPAELRKRWEASSLRPAPEISRAPRFVELPTTRLHDENNSQLQPPAAPSHFTTTTWRLQIERADGYRLTLHLPATEWSRVEALCSSFLQS